MVPAPTNHQDHDGAAVDPAGADHPPDGGSGADGPAGHPPDGADGPDGSNQAKQKWDKRPDDQDGSGFIN
jgi:hypothetical protein